MKAIIESNNNEYRLLLCNGKIETMSAYDIVEFLKTYSDESHYAFDEYSTDISEELNNFSENVIISITDNNQITFHSLDFFSTYVLPNKTEYIEAEEYAAIHQRHTEVIRRYCRNGKIEGAYKEENTWFIPKNAKCPVDGRSTRTVRKKNHG